MLQLAWKENLKESEMHAYDHLGVQYFYLGKLDKAKYYHERMMRGQFESQKSPLRELSLEQLRKKESKKDEKF